MYVYNPSPREVAQEDPKTKIPGAAKKDSISKKKRKKEMRKRGRKKVL